MLFVIKKASGNITAGRNTYISNSHLSSGLLRTMHNTTSGLIIYLRGQQRQWVVLVVAEIWTLSLRGKIIFFFQVSTIYFLKLLLYLHTVCYLTVLSSALLFANDWDQVTNNLHFWDMFSSTVNMKVIPEVIPFFISFIFLKIIYFSKITYITH